jgi:hypothetical protein
VQVWEVTLSPHEPLVHDISNLEEERLMKFPKILLQHLMKTLMDEDPIEDCAFHLFQKKHLVVMMYTCMRPFQWPSSWILRKMCLVSYGECPFQISGQDKNL